MRVIAREMCNYTHSLVGARAKNPFSGITGIKATHTASEAGIRRHPTSHDKPPGLAGGPVHTKLQQPAPFDRVLDR